MLQPGVRHRGLEGALLLGHFVLYGALLVATLTWTQGLVFLAIHQALFGIYLGCSFAPSHKGMPVMTEEQAADPLLRQVLTSRNVRGGPLMDLALGGLNLQIEHHLFPEHAAAQLAPSPAARRALLPWSTESPTPRRLCSAVIGSRWGTSTTWAHRGLMEPGIFTHGPDDRPGAARSARAALVSPLLAMARLRSRRANAASPRRGHVRARGPSGLPTGGPLLFTAR